MTKQSELPDPSDRRWVVAIPVSIVDGHISIEWATVGLASSRQEAIDRVREVGFEVLMDHRGADGWEGDEGGMIQVAKVEGIDGECWIVTVRGLQDITK